MLLTACSNGTSAPSDVGDELEALRTRDASALFQTDSLGYTLAAGDRGYSGVIGVQFTNRTGQTVYFVNCNGATGVRLEKRIGDQWQSVWSPVLSACLSPPITVQPGATRDFRIAVFGGYPGSNTAPQFTVADIAGDYRAVWPDALRSYQDRLPFGEPLALAHRVSNTFVLRVEPR